MSVYWEAAIVLQWVFLILLGLISVGLLRRLALGQVYAGQSFHPTKYHVGDKVAEFTVKNHFGNPVIASELFLQAADTVLLFSSIDCQGCSIVMKQVAELAARPSNFADRNAQIGLVFQSDAREVVQSLAGTGLLQADGVVVLIDQGSQVWGNFEVRSVPTGVVINAQSRVTAMSANPHNDWLYKTLKEKPPSEPVWSGPIALLEIGASEERAR